MGGQFRRTSVTGKQIKEEILRKSVLERVICVSTFYLIMELTKGMSIDPTLYFLLYSNGSGFTLQIWSMQKQMDDPPNLPFENENKESVRCRWKVDNSREKVRKYLKRR